jgi:hypothetical protein
MGIQTLQNHYICIKMLASYRYHKSVTNAIETSFDNMTLKAWLKALYWKTDGYQFGVVVLCRNPQNFTVFVIIFFLAFRLLLFRIFPFLNLLLFPLDMFLISSCCYTLTSFSCCSFSSIHHKLLITFFVFIVEVHTVILSGFYSVKNLWWWWLWLKLLRIWWLLLNVKASDVTRLDIKHTHKF